MNKHAPLPAASARLILDVTYLLNGVPLAVLLERLESMCRHGVGDGWLTGDTPAEVETYDINVAAYVAPPDDESDEADAISDHLQQRIEDGDIAASDVATRMVRYGLMPPDAFVREMRERMGVDA